MASERLLIQIDEKGARVVDARLHKMGNTAQRTSKKVGVLKKALGGIAVLATIRKTIQLADAYTLIQNRLGFVVEGTENLAAVTDQLFRISNSTRNSFESTAEVYTRVALAAKDLGRSQREILDFSKTLNQSLILSGAGAQEARNGMIQLSQSLSSGALRGDELRAVLEQMPVVADIIAKELGTVRGQLRKMGADGEITTQIILDGFKHAREEIDQKFAKTIPTMGQAFIVARNSTIKFISVVNEATGATETLARSIIAVFTAMEDENNAQAVENMAANIIGNLSAATNVADKELERWIDSIKRRAIQAGNVMQFLQTGVFGTTDAGPNPFVEGWDEVIEDYNEGFDKFLANTERRKAAAVASASQVDLEGSRGEDKVAIISASDALQKYKESTFESVKAVEKYNDALKILAAAYDANVISQAEFRHQAELIGKIQRDAIDPLGKLNRELEFQESLLGKTSQQIEVANSLREMGIDLLGSEIVVQGELKEVLQEKLAALQHINEVQEMQTSILEAATGPMEEYRLAQEAVTELLKLQPELAEAAGVALQEYQLAALENSTALADQIEAINVRTLKGIGTQAQAVAKGIEGVYGSLSRVTSEFLKTGKVDFKAWGREIIGIIIKVITQLLIMKAIQGLGGAGGGIAGGIVGAIGQGIIGGTDGGANANGGRFMVGGGSAGVDQTQVAFRATAGERVTVERPDAQGKFGADGGAPVVVPAPQVTVVNVTDPGEIFSALDSDEGEQTIMNVISRNPGLIQGIAGSSGTVRGT